MVGFGKRVTYAVIFVVVLVMALIVARWSRGEFGPHQYGIKVIASTNGQDFYLKREVGLFFDRAASRTCGTDRAFESPKA